MRTVQRAIAGAYIFSSDHKLLLGHNKKGGVYQDLLVIPGGGIEAGETPEQAMVREVREETGLDVSDAQITDISRGLTGESTKTDPETGETYMVHMSFHDFTTQLAQPADQLHYQDGDGYAPTGWFTPEDLDSANIGDHTRNTLRLIRFLEQDET